MNITLLRFVVGLLLMAVPLLVMARLDRRVMMRYLRAFGRLMGAMLVVGVCTTALFRWNNVWLNVLWVLVAMAVSTAVYVQQRRLVVALLLGMPVPTLAVGIVVTGVVLGNGALLDARSFIPVTALLGADALLVCRRGLRAYAYQRKSHVRLFEYLSGNGARPLEAVLPMVKKAVAQAYLPATRRLVAMGLVFLPSLFCALLLCGVSPHDGAMVLVAMVAAGQCVSMLSLLASIYIYERMMTR